MDAEGAAWEFWFVVRKAASILEREAESVVKRELGITLAQYMVLSAVEAYPGPMNQSAIADHLGLTEGTVSRLIESGVKGGRITVTQDPDSRRRHVIELTAEGLDLVERGDRALESSTLLQQPIHEPAAARTAAALLQGFIDTARGYAGHTTTGLPPYQGRSRGQ